MTSVDDMHGHLTLQKFYLMFPFRNNSNVPWRLQLETNQ